MNIQVMGKRWKFIVYGDKRYETKIGAGSHAVALVDDRKIYIKLSSLNKETIIHEMIHAYCHELSYVELQLDDDQVEEFFCELISKHGETMVKDAIKIIDYFRH